MSCERCMLLGHGRHIQYKQSVTMQAMARKEPGLLAGEGWFEVCAEGVRTAVGQPGSRQSPDQCHNEYSASLAEAIYSAAAQALAFLCAVAPQASALFMRLWHCDECQDCLVWH